MHSDERELKDVPQIEARAGYIIPTKPSSGGLSAAMLAVTIACAIGAGAILTTGGQGGLGLASLSETYESVLQLAGWRSPAGLETEQPASLADLQRDIGSVATNIDALATRIDITAKTTDQDMARLRAEVGSLKTVLAQPVARVAVAEERPARSDAADAVLVEIRNDLAALKGELTQAGTVRLSDIEALVKRLDRLEVASAASHDITGSIPTPMPAAPAAAPTPPESVARVKHSGSRAVKLGVPGWTASEVGGAIHIKGPTGVYAAAVRTYIPGLGRIVALRDNGRLVVVGDSVRSLFDSDADLILARP